MWSCDQNCDLLLLNSQKIMCWDAPWPEIFWYFLTSSTLSALTLFIWIFLGIALNISFSNLRIISSIGPTFNPKKASWAKMHLWFRAAQCFHFFKHFCKVLYFQLNNQAPWSIELCFHLFPLIDSWYLKISRNCKLMTGDRESRWWRQTADRSASQRASTLPAAPPFLTFTGTGGQLHQSGWRTAAASTRPADRSHGSFPLRNSIMTSDCEVVNIV